MECQDCNEGNATSLVFNETKKQFFAVCEDCIKDDDFICEDGLINKFVEDGI